MSKQTHPLEDGETVVGILTMFVIGLASNPNMERDVDKLYKKYPEMNRKIEPREGMEINDDVLSLFGVEKYRTMKKIEQAVTFGLATSKDDVIETLLKKYNKSLFKYIAYTDEPELDKAISYIKRGRKSDTISELETLGGYFMIANYVFFTHKSESFADMEELMHYIFTFEEEVRQIFDMRNGIADLGAFTRYKKGVPKLLDDFMIKEGRYNPVEISESLIERDTMATFNRWKVMANPKDLLAELANDMGNIREEAINKGEYARIAASFTLISRITNISRFMQDTTLSKTEVERVLAQALAFSDGDIIHKEEMTVFVLASIYIAGLAKEYLETRNLYREQLLRNITVNKECVTESKEFNKPKLSEEEFDELQQYRRELRTQIAIETELRENAQEKARKLEKEIARLKKELEKRSENDKELIALREFVYNQQEEVSVNNGKSIEEYKDYLRSLDITVVGGNENWTNNMKKEFPDFTYIGGNATNVPVDSLNRKDAKVFQNTQSCSHSIREKIINEMRKNDNPIYFINQHTNVDITVKQMVKYLEHGQGY